MNKLIVLFSVMFLFTAILCGCGASADDADGTAEGAAVSGEGVRTAPDADEYYDRLMSCKEQIEAITDFKPDIAIVLGSGLGNYVDELDVVETIPYTEIDGWPASTAPNHAGNLVFAKYKGLNLAV